MNKQFKKFEVAVDKIDTLHLRPEVRDFSIWEESRKPLVKLSEEWHNNKTIVKILESWNSSYIDEDHMNAKLVDMMCHSEAKDISSGQEELKILAEYILGEISELIRKALKE